MKISGSVVASEGTIGGWTLNTNQISSSGMFMDSSAKKLVFQ